MSSATRITACRFCGGALSIGFCDLGAMPLANSYVRPDHAAMPDPAFPLNAVVCERCYLVQLDHIADAAGIFTDYAYFSSFSSTWLAHAAAFAHNAIARHRLGPQRFVAEIASNDGYLLRNFVAAGIPCLGVEPAANVAAVAIAAGVPTEIAFFGRARARAIVAERGHAALVIANNVLAHVPDLDDFVGGLAILAGPDGVVSIEAPHLLALIEQTQFDTIYHEHYAYWSLHAMRQVLAAHGLEVFALEVLPTHGTSLRVSASAARQDTDASALAAVTAREAAAGIAGPALYLGFDARVRGVLGAFARWLDAARRAGRRVVAYGAAAKGNTFLNAAGVGAADITMVADRNPQKQGRLLPGSRIPIVSPATLIAARPDDVVILPWNIATEVAGEIAAIRAQGGRLWTAIPAMREVR